ncbi:TerC family protein [Parenemella sanctibonifatiensis]|uniref:Transporter n=1 Tax=Parenemella sanctibonifatiensis TaxID=2016505 RepID=A0A255EGL3_9ACTN|nr:TerC family protein [Parenemella sanctibonifatiensis]OYN90666.1 transporter [Parenemella sanctibonifatiensis]
MEPWWVWAITIVAIAGLLAFDFFAHVRKAHVPTIKEAAVWSAIYVGIALLFGVFVWVFGGIEMGIDYYAGYVTEKALSVDNLFVFLIIIQSFRVPRADQQKVLLFGIVFAMFARGAFIAVGAVAINQLSWIFYIFGAILILTAVNMIRGETSGDDDEDEANNFIIRFARKVMHTSDHYDGDKLFTYENGKKVMTPMLLVMVAIGGTDVLFAVDSIPAIFGLTTDPYIVFTATAFSLMGLRQLYFLIDGMLDRLVYLNWGLSIILGFIGVKLVLHALHENTLPFLNGGEHFDVPEITTPVSLAVILGILAITIVLSLVSKTGKVQTIEKGGARYAKEFLSADAYTPRDDVEQAWRMLTWRERQFSELPDDMKARAGDQEKLQQLFADAHAKRAGGTEVPDPGAYPPDPGTH